jgi:hypothetical protein
VGVRGCITWCARVRWLVILVPLITVLTSPATATAASGHDVTVSRGGRHLTVSGRTSRVGASWVAPDPDTGAAGLTGYTLPPPSSGPGPCERPQ